MHSNGSKKWNHQENFVLVLKTIEVIYWQKEVIKLYLYYYFVKKAKDLRSKKWQNATECIKINTFCEMFKAFLNKSE